MCQPYLTQLVAGSRWFENVEAVLNNSLANAKVSAQQQCIYEGP